MVTQTAFTISEAHKKQYQEQGFFVLENVIPEADLAMLRAKSDELVAEQDAEMDRLGSDQLNLSRRGSRYFVFLAYKNHPELANFVFGDLFAEICKATIGNDALLFWEQFVVKGPDASAKAAFSWHQDAGYVDGLPVPAYVNCWIAVDEVNEENGTVYLLPYDKAGTRERVEHRVDEKTGDRVGYFGPDPGVPVIAPAGSIAVFSSTCFHRSGSNLTPRMRRAYALQYAQDVVHHADGSVMGLTEWFLKDGQKVR